jgi:3-phosphoshikimate 1-carboxyvinyltransferase
MKQKFAKIHSVNGSLSFSGDKSISHRVLLISALAEGKSIVRNLSRSADVDSTIKCLTDLGVQIEASGNDYFVNGRGYKGFKKPSSVLNAGNSGTTARLLSGILAVQEFDSVIIGDSSLISRPMNRVIEPLTKMGASIQSNNEGRLPLYFSAPENLISIRYNMPIASAQVKSAILLAGLHLDRETTVVETSLTRNHTENLLALNVLSAENKIISYVSKKNYPFPKEYFIPGDISSAIFFVVLTLLSSNSEIVLKKVLLNSTRIESLNILQKMGGDIQVNELGVSNNEVYGDVIVKSSELSNVQIKKEIIPSIIDEIPALTIAGIFAEGKFELNSASELRVKESDRIKSLITNLMKVDLDIDEFSDGYSISGNAKKPVAAFNSFGDHRIAMAFGILSSLLEDGGEVENFECVSVSNPDFVKQLSSVSN